jgi:hypothetical protein
VVLLIVVVIGRGVPRIGAENATPVATAGHPLVGSWEIDSDANPATDPPALVIFHADGTTVELHEREPDGVGAWQATGPNTATVIIVYHNLNENLVLQTRIIVHGEVEIDPSGTSFKANYETVTTARDGTVSSTERATATGTRITVEPSA